MRLRGKLKCQIGKNSKWRLTSLGGKITAMLQGQIKNAFRKIVNIRAKYFYYNNKKNLTFCLVN